MISYEKLPEHIRGGMKRYIEEGLIPGDFLQAVICNNLKLSVQRADDVNIKRMLDIVSFMYWEVPMSAWGSYEKMIEWSKKGGEGV